VDLVAVLEPCAGVLVERVNCAVEVLMMGIDPKDRDVVITEMDTDGIELGITGVDVDPVEDI
jgi:hypothetical protein